MSVASPIEQAMLVLINQERIAAGVAPLQFNTTLNAAAEDHSENMLINNIFSHTGFDGSTARERMTDAGYVFSGTNASGENIAYQSERGLLGIDDDVRDLHDGLMNSPGHRANILNPNFEEIGIGIEEGLFTDGGATFSAVMVTQNFALTQATGNPVISTPVTPAMPVDPPAELPETSQNDEAPVAPPQSPIVVTEDVVVPPVVSTPPEEEDDDMQTPNTPLVVTTDDEEEDEVAPVIVTTAPENDVETETPETTVPEVITQDDDDPLDDGPAQDDPPAEENMGTPEDVEMASVPENDDAPLEDGPMQDDPASEEVTSAPEEGEAEIVVAAPQSEDVVMTPEMEDDDTTTQSDDGEEFEFADDAAEDETDMEDGPSAEVPIWVKTHDDDTYAKVIADFTADCNAEDFAALDTELQLFVIREFDCNFALT